MSAPVYALMQRLEGKNTVFPLRVLHQCVQSRADAPRYIADLLLLAYDSGPQWLQLQCVTQCRDMFSRGMCGGFVTQKRYFLYSVDAYQIATHAFRCIFRGRNVPALVILQHQAILRGKKEYLHDKPVNWLDCSSHLPIFVD